MLYHVIIYHFNSLNVPFLQSNWYPRKYMQCIIVLVYPRESHIAKWPILIRIPLNNLIFQEPR